MSKLTEFQALKNSGYITLPFSVVWSEDNFLAYATDKGVNVIELRYSGLSKQDSISVKRWFIKPSQSAPTSNCMINVAKLGEALHPDELFKLLLDKTLSPRACLNGITANALSVSWSPFCHPLISNSLLTILTDYGSLDLYTLDESRWSHLASISDQWLGICKEKWDNNNIDEPFPNGIINELKKRAYRVKLTSCYWGKCHNEKWFSLFTANLNGEIISWKIEISESGVEITNLLIFKTDLDSINCLHCLPLSENSFMLMSGCKSGKIQCVNIENNKMTAKSMVWSDMDQLPVAVNSPVATIHSKGIIYVVPKLNHLLIFWLDTDAHLINFTTYSTEDIYITGIACLEDTKFLICTKSGNTLLLEVSISSYTVEVTCEKGEPLMKNNISYSFHGIVPSKNKCIFAVAYSICIAHDTSLIKEPSTIGLFGVADLVKPDTLLNQETPSLNSIWDYIELLRLNYVRKAEVAPLKVEPIENCCLMDIAKLKKYYWLKMCSINGKDVNSTACEDLQTLCSEIKRSIISHNIFGMVGTLFSKKDITEEDKSFLVCAKEWFRSYSNDGQLKTYKKKSEILLSSMKSLGLKEKEYCPLCDSECERMDPELMMKCSQGHKLPRCPRTLQPIISPPYFTCFYCGETSTYGTGDYAVCIMCDAPLRLSKTLLRS